MAEEEGIVGCTCVHIVEEEEGGDGCTCVHKMEVGGGSGCTCVHNGAGSRRLFGRWRTTGDCPDGGGRQGTVRTVEDEAGQPGRWFQHK
ncbi:hypothetical protein OSB04_028573 [Centaurea solstitialis]|uniref:Uncharacterized protein n=1 Tax=Centaurea solstitialis TaxID=347529 RepID=A0AA38SZK2_9ASTR|nr:hypothetical protein OSB04_028573 [Centaurea solstitialis]